MTTAVEALALLPGDARLVATARVRGRTSAKCVRRPSASRSRHGSRGGGAAGRSCATSTRAADAVVFPVRWPEPWGLVPLETMAVGTPAIATATGGAAEYLQDGGNCLVFAPGDAGGLARAVDRLAADPALRDRLRAGGRRTVQGFADRDFERRYLATLEDVAAEGMPRGHNAPP